MKNIANESPVLRIISPPVIEASKGFNKDFDKTPVEFPELKEYNVKISDFMSPSQFIASEGNAETAQEFLLSEVIEFDATYTLEYYLIKCLKTDS